MKNTADVTGGKPIAVRSQSISNVRRNFGKPWASRWNIRDASTSPSGIKREWYVYVMDFIDMTW
jgi:hypothetical protein